MTDYTKATDFEAKDGYSSGDPRKIIKGEEINDEFVAIATAIGTKLDIADLDYKNRIVSYHHSVKASDTTSNDTTAFTLDTSVTMTPASASNKLLIFATAHIENRGGGDDAGSEFKLYIDSTNVAEVTRDFQSSSSSVSNAGIEGTAQIIYEYSPADTSEVVIELWGNAIWGGTHIFHAGTTTLTVLEIEQ